MKSVCNGYPGRTVSSMTLADLVARFPGWHVSLNLTGYHARRGAVHLRAATAAELADRIWGHWGGANER